MSLSDAVAAWNRLFSQGKGTTKEQSSKRKKKKKQKTKTNEKEPKQQHQTNLAGTDLEKTDMEDFGDKMKKKKAQLELASRTFKTYPRMPTQPKAGNW